ncbi:8180_t:CDS:2 [Entrophospora sp. SA101]|nr:8176_t:CDS:2 [Entrophospora sp. SA101]CAJ0645849.1 8180_t:CDS:2 [Entrophospora sp. SA101]
MKGNKDFVYGVELEAFEEENLSFWFTINIIDYIKTGFKNQYQDNVIESAFNNCIMKLKNRDNDYKEAQFIEDISKKDLLKYKIKLTVPPKKQSSHFKKIKESKAQNFKNDLDVNSHDDSETIIGSDEELSSDDELNDEIWYDNTFEDDFNSILPSVFDKMMAASASAIAAANTNPLTSFFPN